jgi:hypothetical protein
MYDFSDLSRAITYWLNYKRLTGLQDLFSEASLVVPIAECLKTKNVAKLRAEINHPRFKAQRGRPRQIDFVGYTKSGQWSFAIEAKYLPATMQSIANDVSRLLLLDKMNCEKYIVIGLPKVWGKNSRQVITYIGTHQLVCVLMNIFDCDFGPGVFAA